MRHIEKISRSSKNRPCEAMDEAGAAFLQVWFAVFSSILLGAFSNKG